VTITLQEMTRFLLSLDQAVDTIFTAVRTGLPGETCVPKVPSARVADIAEVLINGRDIPKAYIGIRPGEKIHEILVSEEECYRTIERDGHYVILPVLPELRKAAAEPRALKGEYSSEHVTIDLDALRVLLAPYVHAGLERMPA
jgi:UDP-glucose 4-epimerase